MYSTYFIREIMSRRMLPSSTVRFVGFRNRNAITFGVFLRDKVA